MRSSTPIFWHSSLMLVNSTDDRYRSPKLHRMTTMSLPAISGRVATLRAATTAAPDEMPQKMPSSLAKRFAISIESSLLTCTLPTQAQQQIKQQSHSISLQSNLTCYTSHDKDSDTTCKCCQKKGRVSEQQNVQRKTSWLAGDKQDSKCRQAEGIASPKNVTKHGLEQNVLCKHATWYATIVT